MANFSANPLNGCAPQVVNFTDQSTGNPTSWFWDLGNGTTSTQQNPSTTYLSPGSFTIKLTTTNALGSNTITKSQYITVYNQPTVNFSSSPTSGCFPLHVNFTDLSTPGSGSLSTWEWVFGDGGQSTQQNPMYIYDVAGTYSVALKVTNSLGCSRVLSKPNIIHVTPGVTTNFNYSTPQLCHPPETINFTNQSTGPGTLTYQWSFGDGGTSNALNTTHTYNSGGNFSATLTTTSSYGCTDVFTQIIHIRNVVSNYSGPDSLCVKDSARFTNASVPASFSSFWNFGDGTTSNQINPAKKWAIAGNYAVKLINNYGSCSDSITKIIKVSPLPIPAFSAPDTINCKVPFTVNFVSTSFGAVNWNWNFGDGGTSTLQNPSHTYTSLGNYTVTLVVTSASGCTDSLVKPQFIKIQKPIVNITGLPVEGCVPFTINPTPNVTSIDGIVSYFWDFGDGSTSTMQNPTHTYPNQGNYTVKLIITTNDGCTDSMVLTNAVVVGTHPFVNFTATPLVQCAGQPIQFTDLSVPADRWNWNFGDGGTSSQKNPSHAYLDTGTFTITLIAYNNGCPKSFIRANYVTILAPVARWTPIYSCINKKQVIFSDSSILPQSWLWDFGDGTTSNSQNPVHLYSAFGTYNVSLTVTHGSCSNTKTIPVTLFDEKADFFTLQDSICTSQRARFQSTGFNKANISTYFWSYGDGTSGFGSDTTSHFYNMPGLYNVKLVITDIRGCKDSITKQNVIRIWGPVSHFGFTPAMGCKPLTVTFIDSSITDGTHPIINWHFDYGNGQTQNFSAPPFVHVYDTTGLFNPSLTITDAFGCMNSYISPRNVFITSPKAYFYTPDSLTCAGKNVSFVDTSQGIRLTYSWSFGDGSTSNVLNPVIVYAADGNYTVKLVVTDSIGCKDTLIRTDYIKVHQAKPLFAVSDSISSCSPFLIHFYNNSLYATTYFWDFGDGVTSTQVNPTHYYTTPGFYTAKLYAINPGGCLDSITKIIHLYPSDASLSYSPIAGCSPLTVRFHGTTSGPVTYLWDMSDGSTVYTTDSNLVYNYLLPGNFVPKLILTDPTGCEISVTGIDTIKVTKSIVNFGVADSLFCDAAIVQFSDSTVSNGVITSYSWSFGDGGSSLLKNPSHSYTGPGLYTVRLIVSTSNGCSDTTTKINYIKVSLTPRANVIGDTSICQPASVKFSAVLTASDTSSLSWKWDFGNGNISNLQNPPTQTYPNLGSFPLTLILTNSSGCADTVNKTIHIHPLPTTNAGNDTLLCLGTPVQLNATGADSYTWTPGSYLSCTNCSSPITSTPVSIWYSVTGKTIYGCTTTDSIFIRVKNPFSLHVSPTTDTLCLGQKIRLFATGAENYLWTPSAGLSNDRIGNPIAAPRQSTIYKLLAYDSVHCFRDSATVNISVFAYPTVEAGSDKTIKVGNSITLSPQYSTDIIKWLWIPANGLSCNTCPNPVAKPRDNTTYVIKVTNNGGCTSQDQVTVFVTCGNDNVFIPNTFSPNGDGVNDIFYPRGTGLFQIQSMRIFNRWGEMVFEKTGFYPNDLSNGWNGTYKGKQAPVDVYTYVVEIICDNSAILPFKGNVTLIR